jgi:hypothetical protein
VGCELELEGSELGALFALSEQHALELIQRSAAEPARAENLAEVVMNRRVVVDDEHAAVLLGMGRFAGHNAADV